jgi:hypothetical protein
MLLLPMAVAVGSMMKLRPYLSNRLAILCTARVVWTELLTGLEGEEFKTGVEFKEISKQDLERLRNFNKEQQNPTGMPPVPKR